MIRFAADEDLDNDILRGLRRRLPTIDIVRVQDADLRGADDRAVLDWTARELRILLTHDLASMPAHALDRVARAKPMPGLIAVRQALSIGDVIEDLVIVATYSIPDEWRDRVYYLPLR